MTFWTLDFAFETLNQDDTGEKLSLLKTRLDEKCAFALSDFSHKTWVMARQEGAPSAVAVHIQDNERIIFRSEDRVFLEEVVAEIVGAHKSEPELQ
jgi:hypothetical protein